MHNVDPTTRQSSDGTKVTIRASENRGHPVAPGIDVLMVDRLVETFYTRIKDHPRLNVLFNNGMTLSWPEHMERMKSFWRSVSMRTAEYNGRPVPIHMKLDGLAPDDFKTWLDIFRSTAHQVCGKAAPEFIIRAERIAESLQMAVFLQGVIAPPNAFSNGVMRQEMVDLVLTSKAD